MSDATPLSPRPRLTRPPIRRAYAPRNDFLPHAEAGRPGAQGNPGYGKNISYFNDIKFLFEIPFPYQKSFLYPDDEFDRPHAPHFTRHPGGAFARAEETARGRGTQKSRKTDEQFCCRTARPRQSQGRSCGQSQCAAPRLALGSASREAKAYSPPDRPRERVVPADAQDRADVQSAARRATRARAALATCGSGCEGRAL